MNFIDILIESLAFCCYNIHTTFTLPPQYTTSSSSWTILYLKKENKTKPEV